MNNVKPKRILFCGYTPIHFICFRSIYKRLAKNPDMEIYFSGGVRDNQEGIAGRDISGMYRAFHVPKERILAPESVEKQSFDMVIGSFVSGVFPKSDKTRIHLFHGISFRNMAVRKDILVYDHLFNVGPYQTRLFSKLKLLRKGDPRLVPIGFPKLDPLTDGSLDRPAILRRLGFSGSRPVLIYAPTGQKFNSLEIMGEEVIQRLKSSGKYDLIIKLHDHPRDTTTDWPKKLRRFEDAHTKLVRDYDVVPYLFASDLLITDASSVSSEYTLLDRPMVFLDVPQMFQMIINKGLALDLDTWGRKGGVTARWPDEAINAVKWSLRHPGQNSTVRKAMARDFFYNPGRATDKAVEWILNWLKSSGGENAHS